VAVISGMTATCSCCTLPSGCYFWYSDVRRLKDTRRHFEKISADMDSALVRNAQAARSKAQECDDAHNYLTAMTSGFYHTALDYVFQVCCMPSSTFCV